MLLFKCEIKIKREKILQIFISFFSFTMTKKKKKKTAEEIFICLCCLINYLVFVTYKV